MPNKSTYPTNRPVEPKPGSEKGYVPLPPPPLPKQPTPPQPTQPPPSNQGSGSK